MLEALSTTWLKTRDDPPIISKQSPVDHPRDRRWIFILILENLEY